MGQIFIGAKNLSFITNGSLNYDDIFNAVESRIIYHEPAVLGTRVNRIDYKIGVSYARV